MTNLITHSAPAQFDVAVVGGGPAGLAAALAFARRGRRTALVLRDVAQPLDLRTSALFPASVRLLENLGAWSACRQTATPLRAIRIMDDTSWAFRAPETLFEAAEIGEAALAWNIANTTLVAALNQACLDSPSLSWFRSTETPSYSQTADSVRMDLVNGQSLSARLAVAADGRESQLRGAAGIDVKRRALDQVALVASFSHSRPHHDISTEIHRDAGPLTAVPLPGNRSSLVWVERPREAARLSKLDDAEFLATLQRRFLGVLGELSQLGPRMSFPLHWLEAKEFARGRVALIGEAAHVMPPIGAQGLNLGFRDAASLAELAAAAPDPGGESVVQAYHRARQADIRMRGFTVDMLNRSLESGTLPMQMARGIGLFAINLSPVLKRAVMNHGAGNTGPVPNLMREPDILPPAARPSA